MCVTKSFFNSSSSCNEKYRIPFVLTNEIVEFAICGKIYEKIFFARNSSRDKLNIIPRGNYQLRSYEIIFFMKSIKSKEIEMNF